MVASRHYTAMCALWDAANLSASQASKLYWGLVQASVTPGRGGMSMGQLEHGELGF